jgi:hypothetical protein
MTVYRDDQPLQVMCEAEVEPAQRIGSGQQERIEEANVTDLSAWTFSGTSVELSAEEREQAESLLVSQPIF